MVWVYNVLLTLLAPFWVPIVWWRTRKRDEAPVWSERFGDYEIEPVSEQKRVWLHAVSVGEVVAAKPILRELRTLAPELEIVLTVTTSSGHRTAREMERGLYDRLFYFPIDVARFQIAALTRVSPAAVAIMETELWMNLLWAADALRVPTMLVNGRISDRSYPRMRWVAPLYRAMLRLLDAALMQSEKDAERIRSLGAQEVEVLGNCKFDQAVEASSADSAEVRRDLGVPEDAFLVVVGSTRSEGEERLVLEALADSRLEGEWVVHAPRHLERAPALLAAALGRFSDAGLRSEGAKCRYLVLDTYGELATVYAAADVVVVGGGFEDHGGQNLIQPMALGKPVLFGPHMQNFRAAADLALDVGAGRICRSARELADELAELMSDPDERKRRGDAARDAVERNLGASRRYAEAIARMAGRLKERE